MQAFCGAILRDQLPIPNKKAPEWVLFLFAKKRANGA
jgi:hypothetical protein